MKQIAIVGTQGVPAKYGGFESLVENIIGENCSPEVQYTVYCSSIDYDEKLTEYKNARLRYIPIHANGMQSTLYDIWGLLSSTRGFDTIVVLGVSGCIFLPFFRLLCKKRLIVNIDGLEHRRAKWGKFAKWFLRTSEAMAMHHADVVVADNKGIQDYVQDTYGKKAALIAYGGDHVLRDVEAAKQQNILKQYELEKGNYAISVCRIEPENNCHITLEAFAHNGMRLVFVGNWDYSEYGIELKRKYSSYPNITLIDSVYDLDILYTLRSNAKLYVHGHSAGGTNPSLVEAMFFGHPILAYDVVYNRETTHNEAYYFDTAEVLEQLLRRNDLTGDAMKAYAAEHYTWSHIARQYEALY